MNLRELFKVSRTFLRTGTVWGISGTSQLPRDHGFRSFAFTDFLVSTNTYSTFVFCFFPEAGDRLEVFFGILKIQGNGFLTSYRIDSSCA
jgi:hypothetical protein